MWDVRFVFWCCGVLLCVVCVVCVGLCLWCVVCGAAWHAEKTRVWVQNVYECRSKTLPCVRAKRAHVFNMRAFCRNTRNRFEPTHGDVLNLHTGRREGRG